MIVKLEHAVSGFCFVNPEQVVAVLDGRAATGKPGPTRLVLTSGGGIDVRGDAEAIAAILAHKLADMRRGGGHPGRES